jgi:hypothetical protein
LWLAVAVVDQTAAVAAAQVVIALQAVLQLLVARLIRLLSEAVEHLAQGLPDVVGTEIILFSALSHLQVAVVAVRVVQEARQTEKVLTAVRAVAAAVMKAALLRRVVLEQQVRAMMVDRPLGLLVIMVVVVVVVLVQLAAMDLALRVVLEVQELHLLLVVRL